MGSVLCFKIVDWQRFNESVDECLAGETPLWESDLGGTDPSFYFRDPYWSFVLCLSADFQRVYPELPPTLRDDLQEFLLSTAHEHGHFIYDHDDIPDVNELFQSILSPATVVDLLDLWQRIDIDSVEEAWNRTHEELGFDQLKQHWRDWGRLLEEAHGAGNAVVVRWG